MSTVGAGMGSLRMAAMGVRRSGWIWDSDGENDGGQHGGAHEIYGGGLAIYGGQRCPANFTSGGTHFGVNQGG